MILSPIEKLRRFLTLELNRKCDNRAVMGGLDKYLPNWQKESTAGNIAPDLIEQVNRFLSGYNDLEREARESAIREILGKLPEPTPAERRPRREPREPREGRTPREGQEKENGASRSSAPSAAPEKPRREPPKQREPRQERQQPRPAAPTAQPSEAAAAPNPVSAPQSDEVRHITHERRDTKVIPSNREIRERNGRSTINPNGPSIDSPVSDIPGIGYSNSKALAKQNVYTVRDFLYYFPRRYDDYSSGKTISQLTIGETATIIAQIKKIETTTRGKLTLTNVYLFDGTGWLMVTWYNRYWLEHQIHVGQVIALSGKVDVYLGHPTMKSPEWEAVDQDNIIANRIVPIYSLNQNLKQNFLRRMIFNTVRHWKGQLPEFLPDSVLESADLLPIQTAIEQIHFPDNFEMLKRARERLAFDEVFLMQLNVRAQKQKWVGLEAESYPVDDDRLMQNWIGHLPFTLTNAQQAAIRDIRKDMASGHPMNRLVQGDVGSGKTVVAEIAALIATQNDGQAAIMAPTGVLAEQHYRNFLKLLETIGQDNLQITPDEVALLTGGTPEARKREIRENLQDGRIKVLIGTHALIEDPVRFNKLALVVIDEQHRFGVAQRAALRAKGSNPHLMVMTATPIPRSLSLTIYGDLDLTVMDELPAGRKPVETHVVSPMVRERVYSQIGKEIRAGHQAFIIYPLVEEGDNEENEGKAAIEGCEKLQNEIFPDYRIALLHGRMKDSEKDAILEAFKNHEYDILVSTSVIEVGVDVPNATMMVIEGANHFGLAQLHQFRGRVGRGDAQARCVLIPEKDSGEENQRLCALAETNDGFKLAEMDLEMRGPGDFIGKRQSGIRELKLASMTDVRLIEKARREAEKLFEGDLRTALQENEELRKCFVMAATESKKGEIS